MRVTAVRAGVPCSWMAIVVVAFYAVAGDGCGSQRSTGFGSRAPTSAQVVTARTYRAEVSAVCKRYNAEIMQIGRTVRGSREHEIQLARATNAATASEARALMKIPRPPGFGRLELLYRAMASTANVADKSTRLFSAGQTGQSECRSSERQPRGTRTQQSIQAARSTDLRRMNQPQLHAYSYVYGPDNYDPTGLSTAGICVHGEVL
jgi:hypothetical protein